jgi:DNA-binding transcriptional regulator YdaS (Cro superfamily)
MAEPDPPGAAAVGDEPMAALDEAIDLFDGVGAFAKAIGRSQSVVSNWRARRSVPADTCPDIERATRARGRVIRCERLRPGVAWEVLRGTEVRDAA